MTPAPHRRVSSPPLSAPKRQLKPLEPDEDPQLASNIQSFCPHHRRAWRAPHTTLLNRATTASSCKRRPPPSRRAAGGTRTRRRKPNSAAAQLELRVELVRSTTASRPPSGRSMLQAAPEAGPLGVSGAGALIWLRALLEAARRLLHRRRDQPYDTDARRLCASQKPLPDASACRCRRFFVLAKTHPSIPPVTTDGSPGGSEASKRFEAWSDDAAKERPHSNCEGNTLPIGASWSTAAFL